MQIGKTRWSAHRLDWPVVDAILAIYDVAWGKGHNSPLEHIGAVNQLREMEQQWPREYAVAKKWFDSPNVGKK